MTRLLERTHFYQNVNINTCYFIVILSTVDTVEYRKRYSTNFTKWFRFCNASFWSAREIEPAGIHTRCNFLIHLYLKKIIQCRCGIVRAWRYIITDYRRFIIRIIKRHAHIYLINDSRYLSDSVSVSRFVDAVSSHISFGRHDSLMVLTSFMRAEYDLARRNRKKKTID